ncbi:Acyl-CoA N-acyltransferase [Penicillium cf. griseofulvum]|uniref:Acyl-CoA N-acyltransferase n=1 Tax=Penicillium cf. griseofulvum TaxID=2972120 RepID=A0A9W9T574_9EURO|nr:Acyl-CoA N-acyltransferase [Penicillium cf. griseofulvum]KAJ5421324.1 Acyl-CoA N-acyltransferase [Penicillium cf. griseofulvum]
MSFEIYPASPTDAPELTQLFYASFRSNLDTTMFPNKPDVTEWWEKAFSTDITRSIAGETGDIFLKVTEGSESGPIAAFAKWKRPAPADRDRHVEQIGWPPSSDKELCDRFFHGMESRHEKWMGERPHYYLDMLGVNPCYQGKGLGSKLLKWGLKRADDEGVEVFLSASPAGKPLYAKHGFREVDTFLPCPDYALVAMIRSSNRQ